MQIWEHLGQHKDFIDMVKQRQNIIDNNKTAIDILDQRLQQFEAGYFDQNISTVGYVWQKALGLRL